MSKESIFRAMQAQSIALLNNIEMVIDSGDMRKARVMLDAVRRGNPYYTDWGRWAALALRAQEELPGMEGTGHE